MRDLKDFCLKGRFPIFIDNFLSNRYFKVRVRTTLSDLQGREEGVPHGSILSVTLHAFCQLQGLHNDPVLILDSVESEIHAIDQYFRRHLGREDVEPSARKFCESYVSLHIRIVELLNQHY